MMTATHTVPFRTSNFLTLKEFLDGYIVVSSEKVDSVNQETARVLVLSFLSAHQIDPYRGWDLQKVKALRSDIRDYLATTENNEPYSQEMVFLMAIEGYGFRGETGWNITNLNIISAAVREHFKMSSVDDLNPDIKKMSDHAKNSNFFREINDRFKSDSQEIFTVGDPSAISAHADNDKTRYRIIAQDDNTQSLDNTILPEAMLKAGEKVLMENYSVHQSEARSAAIEVFRAMSDATPRFDHFDNLKNIQRGESG